MLGRLILPFAIIITSLISGFLYAPIVEGLFLVDLPAVNYVSTTNIPNLILQNSTDGKADPNLSSDGIYGKPDLFFIRRLGLGVELEAAQAHRDGWLQYKNLSSYLYLNKTEGSRMANILIMGTSGKNQLQVAQMVAIGDRIDIVTDKSWRYNFRVTKKTMLDSSDNYLPQLGSDNKLFVVLPVNQDIKQSYVIIESEILSIEEILS